MNNNLIIIEVFITRGYFYNFVLTLFLLIYNCENLVDLSLDCASSSKASSSSESIIKAGNVTFMYFPLPGETPKSIILVGTFNGWNPHDPNYVLEKQSDCSYAITIELCPGKHWFKYYIDNTWVVNMQDIKDRIKPTPTGFVDDGFGGKNAVLVVEPN